MSPARAPKPSPERLVKVSAKGLLLPKSAKDWTAVYIPAADFTVTRDTLPCGAVDWKRANAEAAAVTLFGRPDWRALSHLEYVAHLIEDELYGPAIDTNYFTVQDRYQWEWTGTAAAPSGGAWGVFLNGGDSYRSHQGGRGRVRAVLAGQPLGTGTGAKRAPRRMKAAA
jgi:hypothetical protein